MKKTVIAGFAALMMGLGAITFAGPGNAAPESSHVAGQIMVKFRDDGAAAGVLRRHGLSDGPGIGSTGAHLIKVPAGKELQLIDALSRNPNVEYAEPDEVVTVATDQPNVDYFPRQYALHNTGQEFTSTLGATVAGGTLDADVDAVDAWEIATEDRTKSIKVAVLDTGVTTDNPDISPKVGVDARANFSTAATGEDNYGHGTHVAGIIAATKDAVGVTGVCPGCRILDGKVLNDSGSGSTSSIVNGIDWALDNGAQVINMSLGQRVSSRALEAAVNDAWIRGAVIVAAAGNGGTQAKIYPGAYPNVIAVAATDNDDAKASFSTYGKWVDVAAPGVSVYSTFPNHDFYLGTQNGRSHGYDIASGTSMASPIVAGVAALVWSTPAGTENAAVRKKIESTAERITGTGTLWAHGRVNACKAVGGCP
ncbi:S8 family serine peptidase [Pseudarthrobacter raffinosi]|uniref:S8 family serine peptidase n=1 Tax=Pseudarthrobacter raffinosi TaxID=2953651 RepID=UPI00208F76E5|nr:MULTISPECIES: S8 family serine peptidase [unclassified Pseudarthrobacter]MCO4238623.1 S8 family serine peptidase [Pseudarthrobacter sp. MDT3-28]MCO4249566.1 S8 family serine peptidase [Pseudarthrobacter sp. MDT3-9]MCO4261428.1 S8 family serine peptidase [Pseudarthrobacter sp. MDT3-26]